MERNELVLLFFRSAATGVQKAIEKCCNKTEVISKSQAYRLFGRSDIDRWIAEGLIKPIFKNGKLSKNCIDKAALERIAARSNRHTYLPVTER